MRLSLEMADLFDTGVFSDMTGASVPVGTTFEK
jgi:hypothetical protein